MIEIDSGIPIPDKRVGGDGGRLRSRYPFHAMGVGDSFFLAPDPEETWERFRGRVAAALMRAKEAGCIGAGTTRTLTQGGVKGLRVWRTA